MKVNLVALKAMRYGTRRLRAGENFMATTMDARVLTALGKAVHSALQQPEVQAGSEPIAASIPIAESEPESDAITALRAEYTALTDMPADRRWGEARLTAEIQAIKATRAQAGDLL